MARNALANNQNLPQFTNILILIPMRTQSDSYFKNDSSALKTQTLPSCFENMTNVVFPQRKAYLHRYRGTETFSPKNKKT